MLKFYNTQYKSNISETRLGKIVGTPFTIQKMLSQRKQLIWTQYKSELTIFNNFNRKTATVNTYIEVIVIKKKYKLAKTPSQWVLCYASWMMQEISNTAFNFKQI
jgi:cytochrome b